MNLSIDLHKVKLIIWDLDNTLWNGTLSEGGIDDNPLNYEFVKRLTDHGIINAICSKNDEAPVYKELDRIGLSDYFVFNSINWEAKGNRIATIIKNMNLRPVNVLFLDDDKKNLEEVKSISPDIMVSLPDVIPQLYNQLDDSFKDDSEHKRLKQYKVLEEKNAASEKFGNNEEFLASCDIKVCVKNNCIEQFDRILELINRTNQLNYTKKRLTADDLKLLLDDKSKQSAYVLCKDKFGDYGLVGFYTLKDNVFEHFLFSCRTLGMGVEDFIYNYLGRPCLDIQGYVVNDLSGNSPTWIELADDFSEEESSSASAGINMLFKGPCDLEQTENFFPKTLNITKEFTYVNKNNYSIEAFNHSSQILASKTLSQERKNELICNLSFMDKDYYKTSIFVKKYDVIVYSLLCDYGLGCYKCKTDGAIIVNGQYTINWLDKNNWNYFQNEHFPKIPLETLTYFNDNFEYEGTISETDLLNNLQTIINSVPKDTMFILLGGAEYNYQENNEVRKDRYLLHIKYNAAVKRFCNNHQNCHYIDVNKFITGSESFVDTINHYKKEVYYKIANEIVSLINTYKGQEVNKIGKFTLAKEIISSAIHAGLRTILPFKIRAAIKRFLKL